MEQITREEMIGLLLKLQALAAEEKQPESSSLEWPGMTLHDYFAAEARTDLARYAARAIAALQAAEPVAWIGEEELDGLAMHRRNDFPAGAMVLAIKAGSAKFPLFTLPCPPATELAPESWRTELETIAEILEADGDEWNCAARIRKMLTASPAPDHSGDGNEMVEVPFHKLALGTRFRYTSIPESEYVKISATQVARWQDDMAIAGWSGQGVYSFDEKDRTDTKVLVAVPIGLRQQEETER